MDETDKLDQVRQKINDIDTKLIDLISERIELGKLVAAAKQDKNTVYFKPEREQFILEKVKKLNPGKLDDARMQNIFREIMGATLQTQTSLQVCYLGPVGSFTHQAAQKKFSHSIALNPCRDWDEIFSLVQKGDADYGILPIENSIEGIVNATLDYLLKYNLYIYSEVHLAIHNQLLTKGDDLKKIKRLYSHKQPFGQCRTWIAKNLPHAEYIETNSTSEAARFVSEIDDESVAAISSQAAADHYKMPVLFKNIEDYERNYTRFIIISREKASPAADNRTSLMFAVSHEPGSLFEILKPIHDANINLTTIESRPSRSEPWNYIFYIDMIGHHESEPLKSVLEEIKKKTPFFKLLGSYPLDQDFV